MNTAEFVRLVDALDEASLNALSNGKGLLLENDAALVIGDAQSPNVCVAAGQFATGDSEQIRRQISADAETLLEDYYRTHPLTRQGFDEQVHSLMQQHGNKAFAAVEGHWPQRTLFVEQGTVIAEDQTSPRHRYGVYCELSKPMDADGAASVVEKWLANGEAYGQYLSMNVCRYNC